MVEDAQCASGNRPYFGDTHLHTSLSPDAGLAGTKLGLDEAYRFARGETVTSNSGQKAALKRPLDFLVVADHAENLGLAQGLALEAAVRRAQAYLQVALATAPGFGRGQGPVNHGHTVRPFCTGT